MINPNGRINRRKFTRFMVALFVLALHLPLLRDDRPPSSRSLWLIPLLTGVLIGTVGTIRTEPTTIIASAAPWGS